MAEHSCEISKTSAPAPPTCVLRVLVVEDHPDVAHVLQTLVRHVGHESHWAASGPEAIQAARKFQPHVALLDIGLPGMSGYELAARLRTELLTETPALVALTGNDGPEDRRRSAEAGFAFHLVKPPGRADLAQVLQHFSEQRQAMSGANNSHVNPEP